MDARALARFEAKYEVAPTGCWLWTGGLAGPDYKTGGGYAEMYHDGKVCRAHRLAYEHFVSPLRAGLDLHHTCGVRRCVNPAHLAPLTRGDHLREHAPSHCPQGHEYAGDNLYIDPRANRQCRECRREALRRWRARAA